MSLSPMTFHESYGELRQSTMRLVRKHNVSPADWDQILDSLGFSWSTPTRTDWDVVDAMILAGSQSGSFRPSRYL